MNVFVYITTHPYNCVFAHMIDLHKLQTGWWYLKCCHISVFLQRKWHPANSEKISIT